MPAGTGRTSRTTGTGRMSHTTGNGTSRAGPTPVLRATAVAASLASAPAAVGPAPRTAPPPPVLPNVQAPSPDANTAVGIPSGISVPDAAVPAAQTIDLDAYNDGARGFALMISAWAPREIFQFVKCPPVDTQSLARFETAHARHLALAAELFQMFGEDLQGNLRRTSVRDHVSYPAHS